MPFDISTTYGYFVTLSIQIFGCIVGTTYFAMTIALFIGFCKFATAHVDDIKNVFDEIDRIAIYGWNKLLHNEQCKAMKIFLQAIKHHSDSIA